jgi:hypothetical protein
MAAKNNGIEVQVRGINPQRNDILQIILFLEQRKDKY